MSVPISPESFITLTDAVAYLVQGANQADLVADAINGAAGWMVRRTRRRLRAVTYRTPSTVVGSWTTTGQVTVASTAGLYEDDEAVAAGFTAGSRIQSIDSETQFTLDRVPATLNQSNVTITCGSAAIQLDDSYRQRLYLPEYPVNAVYAINRVYADGTTSAVDITGMRLERDSGSVFLPNARLLRPSFSFIDPAVGTGEALSLRIECHCGYQKPSGTRRGDPEWDDLARIQKRLVQVFFRDQQNIAGRGTNKSIGGQSWSNPDYRMPADIEEGIARYARVA